MRRLVVLALAAPCLVGCGGGGTADAGLGGAVDAPTDAPVPWQCTNSPPYFARDPADLELTTEPPRPVPDPAALGARTQFAQLTHLGPSRGQLYWSETGTFRFRYQLVTSLDSAAVREDRFAFLDDTRRDIWVDGEAHDRLTVDTTSHVVDVEFEIRDVPEGVHNLYSITSRVQLEERPGLPPGTVLTPSDGPMHTLVRTRFEWPSLQAAPGFRSERIGRPDVVRTRPEFPLAGGPDESGMIPLRIAIGQAASETLLCGADYEFWAGFVLMFDGEPIRGVDQQRDVVAAPITPFLLHYVDIDVGPLPRDGRPHRLDVVHVAGLQTAAIVDLDTLEWPYCCVGYTAVGTMWSD